MECVTAGEPARFAFTARRNNSLSSSGRLLVFGLILAVCMGIALALAVLLGAWMIVPFTGLEMLALYLAFRHVGHHAADYERIGIDGDFLAIELRDGGQVRRFSLNRQWAQVVGSGDGSRLALRSHGRELEIGRHRNGEQRLAMGRELKRELKRELRSFG
jgi:uncharacterized membrane protein